MPNTNIPRFQTHIPTDLTLQVASDRSISFLSANIDHITTSIPVKDGSKFNAPCLIQIDTEIIQIVSITANTLYATGTITGYIGDTSQTIVTGRGWANTNPSIHVKNAEVDGYIFSYHHNQIAAEIKAICGALGINLSNVVRQVDIPGDFSDLTNVFSQLRLKSVLSGTYPEVYPIQLPVDTAGQYGGPNRNIQITVDTKGRIRRISDTVGNKNYPVFYKAAMIQGTNAVLGFSFATDGAPNAVAVNPTGVIQESTRPVYAVCSFTQGNEYWVQDHFPIPTDWDGADISLDIVWRASPIVGAVTWKLYTASARAGTTAQPTWNPATSVTATVQPVSYNVSKTRMTAINRTSLQAGDEFFFKFARAADDTCAESAELISIKFNIARTFAVEPLR